MAKDTSFYQYVLGDLFSEILGISSRSMFGGYGFYYHGKIFAIIADGKLYFKVGDGNRKDFERFGSLPFRYKGHNGKLYEMSYWELPPDIMDDKEEILNWVEKAASQEKKKLKS